MPLKEKKSGGKLEGKKDKMEYIPKQVMYSFLI